jgi:hypothetical protein
MPLTLADCRNAPGLKRIAQTCSTNDEFADLVNEATRRLMRRGDWQGDIARIFVCVRSGCCVFPRYVQAVRKINICNRAMSVRNMWYDFLPSNQHQCQQWTGAWGPTANLTDHGRTSVFQDVQGDGRLIRAYPRCLNDIGKQITFFGMDNNGQPLMERNSNNDWVSGVTVTIGNPFGSTSVFVRSIDYAIKQPTQCMVDVYGYNATTNLLEDIAHYEPSETNPSYERTQIQGFFGNPCTAAATPNCCGTLRGVVALVKLKFIPAIADTDLVLIENLDAIKAMIQAIRFGEAGDLANARSFETVAIEVLNRDQENNSPDSEFTVANNVLGAHGWANQVY